MKNRLIVFILGGITGLLLIAICVGVGFSAYLTGSYFINKKEADLHRTSEQESFSIPDTLNLDFETPTDKAIFSAQEAGFQISDGFATSGRHSLMVEFPGGRTNPGIFFDIIGKNSLNWKEMKSLSFNVFNGADNKTWLNVRLKSGEKYPKRVFMKGFELAAGSVTTVIIGRKDLEYRLDLDKISYLGLIISNPNTTFKLYFDEIKVIKNDEI